MLPVCRAATSVGHVVSGSIDRTVDAGIGRACAAGAGRAIARVAARAGQPGRCSYRCCRCHNRAFRRLRRSCSDPRLLPPHIPGSSAGPRGAFECACWINVRPQILLAFSPACARSRDPSGRAPPPPAYRYAPAWLQARYRWYSCRAISARAARAGLPAKCAASC